ncbi:MAG: inositol monophosphatase [Deltaproteobacteria bacterium]|nr:inositol monophosphatase [Deltaproteobacteria bacterium]
MERTDTLLLAAKNAALLAGTMLRERMLETHKITYKGEIDIVTEADKAAEELIIAKLQKTTNDFEFLAEESASSNSIPQSCWVIDPLDGTTNYSRGYPVFCVSIALRIEGQEILGVIYNPMLEELFYATRGKGAFLNEKRVRCSQVSVLGKSLLATGFPYDIRTNPDNNLNHFSVLAKKVQAIRRAGAAALDLAYLAMGRFDGFWELRLKPWDTAAGALLVTEAGGKVTTLHGEAFVLDAPHILASNGMIHADLIRAIATDNG